MNDIATFLEAQLGLGLELQQRLLATAAVIVGLWLARYLVTWLLFRRIKGADARYQWRKMLGYLLTMVGILLVGRIWFEGFQSVATYLGLLSAGLAIALQNLVANVAGWLFVLLRRPFEVGHRVQVGEHVGDVIDLRLFQFTLLEVGNWVEANQSTGRLIHIPNGRLFTEPIANYTQGFSFLWIELPVMVTFESDWEKAKRILTDVAVEVTREAVAKAELQAFDDESRFMIHYHTFTPRVYTSVADSGVVLTMRLLVEPRKERVTKEAAWEAVLRAFAACDDIDLAYPTRRVYNNTLESERTGQRTGPRAEESP